MSIMASTKELTSVAQVPRMLQILRPIIILSPTVKSSRPAIQAAGRPRGDGGVSGVWMELSDVKGNAGLGRVG